MQEIPNIQFLVDFVDRYGEIGVESTSAEKVSYKHALYNVDGSDNDPYINGKKWRPLLIEYGIDGDCYVTNPLPPGPGTSHPGFDLGGHVTPNADGRVDRGDSCYLMPMCKWHNSKARDGVLFSHTDSNMLKLSGYLQGELAATFQARLPSDERFAIVYFSEADNEWEYTKLTDEQIADVDSSGLPCVIADLKIKYYVLFERVQKEGRPVHIVRESRLTL